MRASPAADAIDVMVSPFYRAIGKAIVRWQHIEVSLFVLMHAILGTDSKLSSVVFFHIQSPDSKIQIIDRLCRSYFDEKIIREWEEIHKDLRAGLIFRNAMGHWEPNFITDPSLLEPGEPPIALTRSHLDVRRQADTRGVTTQTAIQVAEEYFALAMRVMRFVARHFSIDRLHATHLQPRLLRYLENIQKSPPEQQPPPSPSPAPSRQARRRAERQRRKR
jgi:hypothetical protein